MRVVTTFDERLYQETGRHLVESLRSHLTSEQILVYGENMTSPLYGVQMLDVASLPELDQILVACRDIIPRESGGDADTLKGYNQRWYNWFRKVIVQYDAIVRRPNSGYTIFLDSDVRMVKSPDEAVMASVLVSAVGVLLGDRESIESGVIVYCDSNPGASRFATAFLELFLSGEFRSLPRWDDGYVMKECALRHPAFVQDLAAGKQSVVHCNSNGHETSGQLLPLTMLGEYFEHDKGVHWRRGLATTVIPQTPRSMMTGYYNWLRTVLGR